MILVPVGDDIEVTLTKSMVSVGQIDCLMNAGTCSFLLFAVHPPSITSLFCHISFGRTRPDYPSRSLFSSTARTTGADSRHSTT
jgi:hypothetical protein